MKSGADPTFFLNFQYSNLPCISKILEKIVASQVHAPLLKNTLFENVQSGFRLLHSTETAKKVNDLLMVADYGLLTIRILLELSAAFNIISHQVILDILFHW